MVTPTMPGSVIDLAQPGIRLPDRLAIDANTLVTLLIAPRAITPDSVARRARVRRLFVERRAQRSIGLIPSTAFMEFIHVAIKMRYVAALPQYSALIGGKKNWELLFKAKPDLIGGYVTSFRRYEATFERLGLIVIQPHELMPLAAGERLERLLLDEIGRYYPDTRDAAILLEMRRAGLDAIVTEDPDLRRAAAEFDVYTWL